jgi:hypothetical protein
MSTYFKNKTNQNSINVQDANTGVKKEKTFFDIVSSPVATIADLGEEVVTGAGKSVEGIVDWGMGVLGTTASIFGAFNTEDALTDAVKYDFAGNHIAKIDDWAEENSWLQGNKVGETIRQVGYGIGGMLPSIAVSVATGGAGAASMGTFMAGAAGQSTEQALYEGADISDATAYGTLSGIVWHPVRFGDIHGAVLRYTRHGQYPQSRGLRIHRTGRTRRTVFLRHEFLYRLRNIHIYKRSGGKGTGHAIRED